MYAYIYIYVHTYISPDEPDVREEHAQGLRPVDDAGLLRQSAYIHMYTYVYIYIYTHIYIERDIDT